MPSTFDPLLRVELQAVGENANTWGTKANAVFQRLAEAIAGYQSINVAGVGDYTLTVNNGIADESRNAILDFTGVLSANKNVIVPSSGKLYVVRNSTTGGFNLTIKTLAGTGVVVAPSEIRFVACDGVNVFSVGAPTPVPISQGGTGSLTAVSAREALGAASQIHLTSVSADVSALRMDAVLKSGSTMTGPLILSSDASVSLQAVTKQQLDSTLALIAAEVTQSDLFSVQPGTTQIWNHGFNKKPIEYWCVLECITADLGYSPGDEIYQSFNFSDSNSWYSISIVPTTASIILRQQGNVLNINHATAQFTSGITFNRWGIRIRAKK